MMRISKTVVLTLILLSMLVLALPGQSPSPTQSVATPTPAATATPTPGAMVTPMPVVDVLKQELDSVNKYNDKILTTVYWFIGTFAGVFVIVSGVTYSISYVSAIKMRKSEREALLGEINKKFTDAHTELYEKFGRLTTTLTTRLDERDADHVKRVTALQNETRQEITKFEYVLFRMEFEAAEKERELLGSLLAGCRQLEAALVLHNDWYIKGTLHRMAHLLQSDFPFKDKIDDTAFEQVGALIEKVPEHFAEQKERLLQLMEARRQSLDGPLYYERMSGNQNPL